MMFLTKLMLLTASQTDADLSTVLCMRICRI